MNVAARSVLPLFFGLTSLTAVACAAPVATPGEQGSTDDRATPAAIDGEDVASKLSGMVGSNAPHARGGELPETESAMAALITELVVEPGPSETVYEVLSYSFGIATAVTIGSSSGGAGADKSTFAPLSVTVRPLEAGTAPLMSRLTTGTHIDKLVLRQRATAVPGTKVAAATTDIAELGMAFVSSMATGIQNGTMDSYGIEVGNVTLKLPGSKAGVGYDLVTRQWAGEELCGKRATASLGPYVQADAGWVLPKGSVRIDSAQVAITNAMSLGSGLGGAATGKAKLEQIAIDSPMERTGLCAFYYSALGARVAAVQIDAASSVDKSGALVLAQRWEACGAYATQVMFSGGSGEAPRQTIVLDAEGVLRTDYSAGKAANVFGWSFVENNSISSCAK